MKDPTADQKRSLAGVAEPLLSLLYRAYRRARVQPPSSVIPDLTRPERAREVQKVLVIRLDAIGDLLLSEPALAVLRQRFPQARIDLVANPASAAVLRGNPNIDHLIGYRAPWHAAWRGATVDWRLEAARLWGVTLALRRERYNVGFELRGDLRDILFMAAATPNALVGSGVRGGRSLLDCDVSSSPLAHQVELAAAIASLGEDHAEIPRPHVYVTRVEREEAEVLLHPERVTPIALHLGAGFASKCLPIEQFALVVNALQQQDLTRRFVVVGGSEEKSLVEELRQGVATEIVDLTGGLSLLQTAAVLERCRLFIGNDSAPMHLAAAAGTPVVTFFGPSEPWKFHPYRVPYRLLEVDLECRPCDYVHCIWPEPLRYQCMTRQSAEAIVAAAEELLETHTTPAQ